MINKRERGVLAEAAKIIARELVGGSEVRIPHFGKFYLSEISVYAGQHPMAEDGWDSSMVELRLSPRFRAFARLRKSLIQPARERAAKKREESEAQSKMWAAEEAAADEAQFKAWGGTPDKGKEDEHE